MTRIPLPLWTALLAVLAVSPIAAQSAPPAVPDNLSESVAVQSELEDVFLLEALRALRLSTQQREALLPIAHGVRDRVREAGAEEARRLMTLKEKIVASRQRLLAGETAPATTLDDLRVAVELARQRRSRLEEELVQLTGGRLARVLTRTQMEVIYSLTRETNLGGAVASPLLQSRAFGTLRAGRTPEEEYLRQRKEFQEDLDDWREEGDERDDLIREISRGIPRNTPHYQQTRLQAGALLDQIKAMPEGAYHRQLDGLLDRLARASVATRQREDRAKFLAAQTPARQAEWLAPFVRRVFLSPRIVPVLEALVSPGSP